jgi:hypothetical protein
VAAAVNASRGKSVRQRICDLVVPGSHMAVHVLRYLYRLRYQQYFAASTEDAVVMLRGFGPEVFLLEDTEGESAREKVVAVGLSEAVIKRWSTMPYCR